MADAAAWITAMLGKPSHAGELGAFLPAIPGGGPEGDLQCRAAVASAFVAGLELARDGKLHV